MYEKAVTRQQDNKSLGNGLIGCWYKHVQFFVNKLTTFFSNTFSGNIERPEWLTKGKTVLLPINNDTRHSKNYYPIVLQNIMLKFYTRCIKFFFLQLHCENHSIITAKQAGSRKEVLGCSEQLMINKAILEEVKYNRCFLITVWLDYQKSV